ncbi:uncharacterized protein KY384_002415 [Bacidia gigantensis]|uniref:uncharacterized protein n=1 Tax=Bacidia gigantensis TaxID=2732470 RepID=UPI001D051836|nr:uncharacterized protein KY384_002415 [Bacidia gigantensis]KAG8532538.1 hypothetical protein KY384_002415 [Bacidia gigantensis]
MDRLQREYGDFVRTGPNELTIFKPEAYSVLHGSQSRCTKAAWYDVLKPNDSMHSTRIKAVHGERKRVWDRAFSTKAVAGYEPRILKHLDTLDQRLSSIEGHVVNATDLVFFFVADVVGDIVSGVDFAMTRTGKKHFAADLLSSGFKPVGYLNPIPWLLVFLMAVPGFLGPYQRVVKWSKKEVERRLQILVVLVTG